jgi:adenosylmethionine-8-amino-7-oxononanoate aminotransferase
MNERNAPYVARDLAHVWHPCTQMKDHEQRAACADSPRRGRLAGGFRRQSLPRRRELLVGESVWPFKPAHQCGHRRAAATSSSTSSSQAFTHEPVIALSEALVKVAPRG